MAQARVWIARVLFLPVFVVFLMGTTGAEAQTAAPAGQAKVDRLVMGSDPALSGITCARGLTAPRTTISSMTRRLSGSSRSTPIRANIFPGWPRAAEMAKDGRSWRIKLRQGVQFHHGYGEFTAKDVVHNHALWCDDNYPGRKDPPLSGYRKVFAWSSGWRW